MSRACCAARAVLSLSRAPAAPRPGPRPRPPARRRRRRRAPSRPRRRGGPGAPAASGTPRGAASRARTSYRRPSIVKRGPSTAHATVAPGSTSQMSSSLRPGTRTPTRLPPCRPVPRCARRPRSRSPKRGADPPRRSARGRRAPAPANGRATPGPPDPPPAQGHFSRSGIPSARPRPVVAAGGRHAVRRRGQRARPRSRQGFHDDEGASYRGSQARRRACGTPGGSRPT